MPNIPPRTLLMINIKKYKSVFELGRHLNIIDKNRRASVFTVPVIRPLRKPFFSLRLPLLKPNMQNSRLMNIKLIVDVTL